MYLEISNIHAAIEIHPVDTNCRIILDSQIDMFTDAETEIAGLREVPPLQFVFLNLQPSLENFFSFWTADGDVNSDFLITADTECSDGVAGFAYERTSKQGQRIDCTVWSSRRPEAKDGE